MQTVAAQIFSGESKSDSRRNPTTIFIRKFQHALKQCVKHGFTIEESFGLVWEETLEEVTLSDHEQSEAYPQLIAWAKELAAPRKQGLFTPVVHQNSGPIQMRP